MPKAHTIDWPLAQALRMQGLNYDEIAKRAGGTSVAIRSKACREGWANVHKRASETLQQHGLEIAAKTIKEQAPKLAAVWLEQAQEDTVESIAAIRKLPKPSSLGQMKQREEMMLTHVKRGRAAFGLDDQQGRGATVNVMAQLCQIAVSATPATSVATDETPCCTDVEVVDSQGE